jgi:hypothetical protein
MKREVINGKSKIRHTDQASTMNTKTKANQIVYKQEVNLAITSTAKPLVRYT